MGSDATITLTLDGFMDMVSPYVLVASDIVNMKPDESVDVLCFDRNMHDLIDHDATGPTDVLDSFSNNYRFRFTKVDGLEGTVKWFEPGSYDSFGDDSMPMYMHLHTDISFDTTMEPYWYLRDISEVHPMSKVGWRGSCIRLKDLPEDVLIIPN